MILPAVICFVQGLSHASLSVHGLAQWVCEWLLTSAVTSVIEHCDGPTTGSAWPKEALLDILQNLVANTRSKASATLVCTYHQDCFQEADLWWIAPSR